MFLAEQRPPLLRVDANGLWCEAGGFYIDPWFPAGPTWDAPVERALITHGHSDHARRGARSYLCAAPGAGILRARLGDDISLQTLPYGEQLRVGDVNVSFHPAGHVLGSAQIRVEYRGEIWVASGDYKTAADGTSTAFEPVRCNTFITESTFGLPIYRWPEQATIMDSIHKWWRGNQERGKCTVIFAYPLGKSQRVLAALNPEIGPIYCHGAVERLNRVYRDAGTALPPTRYSGEEAKGFDWSKALVIAPPSSLGSPWMKKFGAHSTGMVSGWMRIRGTRRRRSIERGFVLSDHADWPGLLRAIEATGAETILPTHGYRAPLVRWCQEHGLQARALETRFEGERDESGAEPSDTEDVIE